MQQRTGVHTKKLQENFVNGEKDPSLDNSPISQ